MDEKTTGDSVPVHRPTASLSRLVCCYLLCRVALDRHRLARWEQAWAVTGPRWTSRR